jgi:hypothetical protein
MMAALNLRFEKLQQTVANSRELLKSPWRNNQPQADESGEVLSQTGIQFPWKERIATTVFWVGEHPTKNNPVPNDKSSWDKWWKSSYGGYDNPDARGRIGFRPAGFLPKQNPFYVALPYNDISGRGTKPEARHVIPWFNQEFTQPGKSVVKGHWIAIHHNGRVCYAPGEDCGPYRTDHWQYVFGNDRPAKNPHHNAGLDVSPAVRDYLGLSNIDYTDWKFVDIGDIPNGPWTKYGENNPFSPYYSRQAVLNRNQMASLNQNIE